MTESESYLNTLHLFGPTALTWLLASSIEMKRFLASFHLSPPSTGLAGSFPVPPFCVRPCLPNLWMALRIGPAHPLAHRWRVTGSQLLPVALSVKARPFRPMAGR